MTPPTEERRAELRAKAEAARKVAHLHAWFAALGVEEHREAFAASAKERWEAAEPVIALLDHITALEAALRPFAEFADAAITERDGADAEAYISRLTSWDTTADPRARPAYTTLTVGDFRRAASLLPGEGNA